MEEVLGCPWHIPAHSITGGITEGLIRVFIWISAPKRDVRSVLPVQFDLGCRKNLLRIKEQCLRGHDCVWV